MKLTIEKNDACAEPEVLIRCAEIDDELQEKKDTDDEKIPPKA